MSRIIEWNPNRKNNADTQTIETTDAFVWPHLAGYNHGVRQGGYVVSDQVVWLYKPTYSTSYYSNYISGQQRRPNGNTLIVGGAHGHFFEVTPQSEIVWEYTNPSTGLYAEDRTVRSNAVFRVRKLPVGHPALEGKDLSPKGDLRRLLNDSGNDPKSELGKFLGFPASSGGGPFNPGGGYYGN